MAYTNSKLISYTKLSPNHSGQRTHSIDRITPHCVVGQLSAESICGCFTSPSRQASCNYGIGKDGRISLCVEEKNRSWCSSSNANDQRAVTIECASDMSEPYAMNSAVYNSLIKLFDVSGNIVYPTAVKPTQTPAANTSYKVQIDIANLNIRKGPGTNYGKTGQFTGKGIFTIVQESKGEGATLWGKLKSGAGWISLDFAKKI